MKEAHKELPRQLKEERQAEETKLEVDRSPVRCPYCHDSCTAEDLAAIVCQQCLSRHHAPCWREAGRCASCSSTRSLSGEAPVIEVSPAEVTLIARGLSREAVEKLRRRHPDLSEAEALRALLEAASGELQQRQSLIGRIGLSPEGTVAVLIVGLVLSIPILAIVLGG